MNARAADGGRACAFALVSRPIERLFEMIGAALMAAIVIDVLIGVFSRYVLGAASQWTEAAGRWLLLYLVFVGSALAERQGRQIAVDLFEGRLPPRAKSIQSFLVDVVSATFLVAMLFYGYGLTTFVRGTEPLINLPIWMKMVVVPVTMLAGILFKFVRSLESGNSLARTLMPFVIGGVVVATMGDGAPPAVVSWLDVGILMGLVFAVAAVLGAPLLHAMVIAAFLTNFSDLVLPQKAIVENIVTGTQSFLLLAIPMFIFVGVIMADGALGRRLLDLANLLVGRFRGGLAQVNVLISFMFGGISGSASSDVALLTKLLVPEMVRRGYSKEFSCAITSAASLLTNIVPPSISLLIFAEITGASVIDLFLGGVGPAVVITGLLMGTVYLVSVRRGYQAPGVDVAVAEPRPNAFKTVFSAIPVLGLVVVVVGGIRLGIFTPVESAGVAVLYALVISVFPLRSISLRKLLVSLKVAAVETAMICFLIAAARPFTNILYTQGVPDKIVSAVLNSTASPNVIMLTVIAVGLLLGTALDLSVSILILVPLVMPLLTHVGFDVIHAGLVITVTLLVGSITPPVGLMVFMSAAIANASVARTFREAAPFTLAYLVGIMVMAFVPWVVWGPLRFLK